MYRDDVKELLEHTKKQIITLKKDSIVSKITVKNILENLRSSLEYCAQYINREKLLQNSKVYFPYGKSEEIFRRSIQKNNFSILKDKFPHIYSYIEELQPHKCNDEWLTTMCEATNEAKHNKSLDIETNIKKEEILTNLNIPGIGFTEGTNNFNKLNFQMTGCTFNGKSIDDFHILDGNVKIIKKGEISPEYDFEIIENKTFILNSYSCDLFELLEKSYYKISNFSNKLFE